MRIPSHAHNIVAGLALILAPLLAILLKFTVYPGWMILILFFSGIPLFLGYAVQVVIASTSMFRAKGVFNTVPGAMRGVVAAWVTSISVFLSAFFLIDGGDSGEGGSAFTLLFTGGPSTAATEGLSMALLMVFAFLWIGSWLWLLVEWIILLAQSRATKPNSARVPQQTPAPLYANPETTDGTRN